MSPRVLFAIEVAAFAAFPIAFALLRTAVRYIYFYTYIAIMLFAGGFLGSIFAFPLTDGVALSAGSVAYGGMMMSILVLVIVGRDIEVVRNIIRLVIVVNVFKLILFAITARALDSKRFLNPFGTSTDVFDVSIRVLVVGGVLIVAELVLLVAVFELVKRYVKQTTLLPALYVIFFIAVLCLDGVLFPSLAFTFRSNLATSIRQGVHAKLILALAFSVPFVVFLAAARSVLARYAATPLPLQEIVFTPHFELVDEIERQRDEIAAKDRELADTVGLSDQRAAVSRALARVDADRSVGERLAEIGAVFAGQPGMKHVAPSLAVLFDGVEIGRHGDGGGAIVRSAVELRRGGVEPWVEHRSLGDVLCMPLHDGASIAGVLELGVERPTVDELRPLLGSVSFEVSAMFRDVVSKDRRLWADRASIMSILGERRLHPVFQPIVSLDTGATVGYEALSRFDDGLSPEERFREASRLGLSCELETMAFDIILGAAEHFDRSVPISINISPNVVFDPALAALIAGCGRELTLEITEHDRVDSYEQLSDSIRQMPRVRLSVDDAGSGYASLRHIFRLRPDFVKLDRQWVREIDADRPRQVLVRGLLLFVEEIGGTLIAEGIEREEEAETLRLLGVPLAQGFLFARPAPADAFDPGPLRGR